jgi:AAA domain, putative AbiEii toxin, Type IV TA system
MKFKFEDIGLIDEAEIELADLTLICGDNNTGKTYVTYGIYGFLRIWRQLLRIIVSGELKKIDQKAGGYSIDLQNLYCGKINHYLARMSQEYVSLLPDVFAASEVFFKSGRIDVSVTEEVDFLDAGYQNTIQGGPSGKVLATLKKTEGSPLLEVLVADEAVKDIRFGGLNDFIADAVADIVFAPYIPDTMIASAERTGAAIFRKELDFARTRMIEALGTLDSKDFRNPFRLIESMEAGYAWPVKDNVNFVRQLEDIDKQTGPLASAYPQLIKAFDEIIGGSYKVVRDKGLFYQPKGSGKPRLSMAESSSSVRALLDVGFYLRCRAKPGDLFIIDEPELNLHPKNQRAFARLIARMINSGIKVFITTHSDYLVKELNTLIMLAQRTPHTKSIQKTYDYVDDELLDSSRVHLYMTCTRPEQREGRGRRASMNTLRRANIYSDRGIEVTTFDTTIEEMNDIQGSILYGGDL